MSRILLSIHPEYVNRIINGKKSYEFRKIRCKRDVESIVIYATAPVCKIVAEVEVIDIIEGNPDNIWKITRQYAGISKKNFENYYKNSNNAVAYKLGEVKEYSNPVSLSDFGIRFAPQSYIYI